MHNCLTRPLIVLLALLPALALAHPRVALDTSQGTIVVELYEAKAPATVTNFLDYVDSGFYDGTVFHRVIAGFMIQGGGFDDELNQKKTRSPIPNEADNGLKNERGTLAMARTSDPDSATAQFFINLTDNTSLDHRGKTPRGWGYAVFGRVIEGMEVVDRIARLKTGVSALNGYPARDVPRPLVVINNAKRLSAEQSSAP
jgi:peptidyl-prolyl cis-trans isomerase A (cyclophilin A)/peptidyl-prolyl cis-trans isomerase B (cyclophilin B)